MSEPTEHETLGEYRCPRALDHYLESRNDLVQVRREIVVGILVGDWEIILSGHNKGGLPEEFKKA